MAADLPPAVKQVEAPIVKQSGYGPVDVRYSEFLKMVDSNRIEKVTFSADGTQLLGVDVDGARVKIEALPNDPNLLTELTSHKVREAGTFSDNSRFFVFLTVFAMKLCMLGRCYCGPPGGGSQWFG
jgi:ATP-dependent Zn protease